jgi:hypothetical protein
VAAREVTVPPAVAREVTLPPAVAWPVTVPPPPAVPSDGNGTKAGAPSPSDVTAPEELQLEPQPVGAQTGLTEHGLPQRVRQMSLAPQLRDSAAAQPLAAPVASPRSPEKARSVMSAFRQGWRLGLSENGGKHGHSGPHHPPAPPTSPDLPQEGDSK